MYDYVYDKDIGIIILTYRTYNEYMKKYKAFQSKKSIQAKSKLNFGNSDCSF